MLNDFRDWSAQKFRSPNRQVKAVEMQPKLFTIRLEYQETGQSQTVFVAMTEASKKTFQENKYNLKYDYKYIDDNFHIISTV